MTRYLLDTNHASVFWRRRDVIASKGNPADDPRFGLCIPSIGELWYMVFNSVRVESNAVELQVFLDDYEHWPYDQSAANEFGRIKSELRKVGRPIPDVDVQIAAIARANQLVLLTADAHFEQVSGLQVENWLSTSPGANG